MPGNPFLPSGNTQRQGEGRSGAYRPRGVLLAVFTGTPIDELVLGNVGAFPLEMLIGIAARLIAARLDRKARFELATT